MRARDPRGLLARCLARRPVAAIAVVALTIGVARAETARPFGLPFEDDSGAGTWFLAQPYGNTVYAFYERSTMYSSVQGLHMGIDLAAACGRPVLSIGDGVVRSVDGPGGSGPHNLVIDHGNGYVSLYGHLLEPASVAVGQRVAKGEVVALSGDMYGTCHDSPHLHLEIRDSSLTQFYNPMLLIAADWHSLVLVGPVGPAFERDLDSPRLWQAIDDQPTSRGGGPLLNDFEHPWPDDEP